jgi:hypothetical protein
MTGRYLLVAAVIAFGCSAAPAWADQRSAPPQTKRAHSSCPNARQGAPARADNQAPQRSAPIQVSAGSLPLFNIRRFLPDLMP